MTGERIKALREKAGYSQTDLSRKLSVSRASINAWESGLSAPTAVYLVELSKLFHVSTDYLLELDSKETIDIASYSKEEKKLIYQLLSYMDKKR